MPDRPRLLLVPSTSELEWEPIRPLLEEWAEVASFDLPGVGADADPAELSREASIARAHEALGERGWSEAIFVGDQFGSALAVLAAHARPASARALALGHACLRYSREGDRPPISAAVADFQLQLTELSAATGKRMLVQGMEVTYGAQIAAAIEARLPEDFAACFAQFLLANQDVDLEPALRELDVPLLFGEHAECALWTVEGFADAAAAFPAARTIATLDNPGSSPAFAEALREFAEPLSSG